MLLQDWIVIISTVITGIVLLWLHRKQERFDKLKFLLCIPAVLVILHVIVFRFNITLLPAYASALLFLVVMLVRKKKVLFYLTAIPALLAGIISSVLGVILPSYASESSVAALHNVINKMQNKYVLTEHKEIDYNKLLTKYERIMQEAEAKHDPVEEYIAWLQFTNEFHDAHISCSIDKLFGNKIKEQARDRIAGYDYGFSMLTLTTGETVACLVDENSEAYKAGIRNGTIITNWNGTPIEAAKNNVSCYYPGLLTYPVLANERAVQGFFLAGGEEENLTVTFMDRNNQETTISLGSIGRYQKRLSQALNALYSTDKKENLEYRILNNGYGYLCVNAELNGLKGMIFGNYKDVRKRMQEMVDFMKKNEIKKLVIDLRNNVGGDDRMGMEIVSFFTGKEMFYYADGVKKDGKYVFADQYYCKPKGSFLDVEITVLVNSMTVSAGDGLAYNLGKLPNVSIAGMTDSACSFQAVGGNCVVSNSGAIFSFPVIAQLGEAGDIMVDTNSSREATIKRDIEIPITVEVIDQIFSSDIDYELAYIISR